MACIEVKQLTPTWLPVIEVNNTNSQPRIGITFNQLNVSYKRYTDLSFISKTLDASNFRENGNGIYEVNFTAAELGILGSFLYVSTGNAFLPPPTLRQFIGQAFIVLPSLYTGGAVVLPTNILTGNLINLKGEALVGESVSARIVQAPTILGVNPDRGGIGTQIVSCKTDATGFFALVVVQGAIIDVVIPIINYRRTLTVPANSTDKLFDIP